jgi:hypothetical protein
MEPDREFYWLFVKDDEGFPMPVSKDKKIAKLIYEEENETQMKEEGIQIGQMRDFRRGSISSKMRAFSVTEKEHFCLLIRKRIFSSLHTLPNFKNLTNPARNFLYHQIRQDYVEREILMKPNLSNENAVLLAALSLKIKFQTKILRSKENSLTVDIISKNMEYCMPSRLLLDKSVPWADKIQTAFE